MTNETDPTYLKMVEYFGDDPNIERIEPPEEFDLPNPFRIILPRFNTKDGEMTSITRRYILNLYKFISFPYLLDRFEDPNPRENWRMKFGREQGKDAWNTYNENALRPSQQLMISYVIQELQQQFLSDKNTPEWTDKFNYLAGEIFQHRGSDEYRSLPREEQVEFVRSIKTNVVDLLRHLTSLDDLLTEKSQIHPDIESHVLGSLGTVNSTIWALSEPEVRGHEKKSLLEHKKAQLPGIRAFVRDGFLKPQALELFDIDPEGETTPPEENSLNYFYERLKKRSNP